MILKVQNLVLDKHGTVKLGLGYLGYLGNWETGKLGYLAGHAWSGSLAWSPSSAPPPDELPPSWIEGFERFETRGL